MSLLICGGRWLYHYLEQTEHLALKTIGIEGVSMLDPEEVIAASGLTSADNVLFFDAKAARKRVEGLPHIKSCRISRSFPDRVVIAVEERVEVATLLVENRTYGIDAEGIVLRELSPGAGIQQPLLADVPDLRYVETGQALPHPPLHEGLAVWEAFSQTRMARDLTVSELSARAVDDIRMVCDELPFEIRWGRGNYASQSQRLDFLWDLQGGELDCSEYLELRFEPDLVCK